MKLIQSLRDNILDSSVSISDTLRRAKVLASLLKNEEFKRWVDQELNGYTDNDSVPNYRRIKVQNFGTLSLPFGRMIKNVSIPTYNLPDAVKSFAKERVFPDGISRIEALAQTEENLRFAWPAEALMLVQDLFGPDQALIEAYQPIDKSQVQEIAEAVRNKLLDFALELQELRPEILESESAISELPQEQVAHIFNLTIHGSHNVVASGSGFQQTVSQSIAQNDLKTLIQYFRELGVDEDALNELENSVSEDGPRPNKKFGERVKGWIGKMTVKALEGVWKVSVDSAPKLIVKGLSKYYGWEDGT